MQVKIPVNNQNIIKRDYFPMVFEVILDVPFLTFPILLNTAF